MVDYDKLEAGLQALTGYDLEKIENQERASGNSYPSLEFTKSFQIRVAAKALGVQVQDLKELSLKDYHKICNKVFGFLYSSDEKESPDE